MMGDLNGTIESILFNIKKAVMERNTETKNMKHVDNYW